MLNLQFNYTLSGYSLNGWYQLKESDIVTRNANGSSYIDSDGYVVLDVKRGNGKYAWVGGSGLLFKPTIGFTDIKIVFNTVNRIFFTYLNSICEPLEFFRTDVSIPAYEVKSAFPYVPYPNNCTTYRNLISIYDDIEFNNINSFEFPYFVVSAREGNPYSKFKAYCNYPIFINSFNFQFDYKIEKSICFNKEFNYDISNNIFNFNFQFNYDYLYTFVDFNFKFNYSKDFYYNFNNSFTYELIRTAPLEFDCFFSYVLSINDKFYYDYEISFFGSSLKLNNFFIDSKYTKKTINELGLIIDSFSISIRENKLYIELKHFKSAIKFFINKFYLNANISFENIFINGISLSEFENQFYKFDDIYVKYFFNNGNLFIGANKFYTMSDDKSYLIVETKLDYLKSLLKKVTINRLSKISLYNKNPYHGIVPKFNIGDSVKVIGFPIKFTVVNILFILFAKSKYYLVYQLHRGNNRYLFAIERVINK